MSNGNSSQQPELVRLQAAVQRERLARQEAEAIAERGMRQLYRKTQELELFQAIAEAANQAASAQEALQTAVDRVCAYTGWPVGHAYILESNAAETLVPLGVWHLDHPDRFAHFRAITEASPLSSGVGLPGRVLQSGRPAWIIDVMQDPNFRRAHAAEASGIRTGFAIPVVAGARVAAVLEFFSAETVALDEALLETMTHIGTQLGRVIERQQAATALGHSEERYRRLVEVSPDAVLVSRDNRVAFANGAALRLFGASGPQELLGKPLLDLVQSDFHAATSEVLRQLQVDGLPVPVTNMRVVRLDGTIIDVEVTACPFDDGGARAVQVILRDITDRRRLEDQLRQAQKMEAVGQLAGGVAHDFNNLLTVITGYSEFLLRGMKAENTARQMMLEVKKAAERAEGLTRQLLAFSRRQVIQPRILHLNELVTEMEKMLRRMIGEDIDLGLALAPALGQVKADPGQVEQVLMNLAVNARDAMPQGGKLTIETWNGELDVEYSRLHPEVNPGRYVVMAVSDTGCGMNEATRARIFEPFFTTKGVGKGTGLGLATVYGIVKQSGGHIEVYSEPGFGTSFKIYLPRINTRVQLDDSQSDRNAPIMGTETVLLVEDEDVVREVTSRVLYESGYTILAAACGADALRTAAQHSGPIHLLLTDVVMPGMSGRELAERLQPSRPAMRTLYLSGYTDDAIVRHGVLEAEVHFLQKPFSPNVLASKIREVLDGTVS